VSKDVFTDKISIRSATEIPLSNDWNDISAIHQTRGVTVERSEDLVFVIELPLYKACRMLYDAGIQTTESNAHFEPSQEEATIVLGIKWDSLNESQQNMAETFCAEEPDKWRHYSAEEHGDGYEAVYLNWKIKRHEVNPRQVKAYIDQMAQRLIQGKIKIKGKN
jgi:hypothetical protein